MLRTRAQKLGLTLQNPRGLNIQPPFAANVRHPGHVSCNRQSPLPDLTHLTVLQCQEATHIVPVGLADGLR